MTASHINARDGGVSFPRLASAGGVRHAAPVLNPGAVAGCALGGGVDAASPTFLTLPAPPSVNRMFRNVPGVGRVKAKQYEKWIGEAGWRLRSQKPAHVKGPILILIGIERTSALADIDNRIKPALDLLVTHRVIEDDRFVIGVAAAWSPPRDGLMRLAVIPAADMAVRFHLAPNGRAGGWFLDAPSLEEEIAHHGD